MPSPRPEGEVPTLLDQQRLPTLEVRAPTTDPLLDPAGVARFLEQHVRPTGVQVPTVLQLSLEGRFMPVQTLFDLVVPLARSMKAGEYGPLSMLVTTTNEATRAAVSALAQHFDLPVYVSDRVPDDAHPAAVLTASQRQVLDQLRLAGGRGSASQLAEGMGTGRTGVGNVLADLADRGLVFRMPGAGRRGHVYLDPGAARPAESAAHPESLDFDVPAEVRDDVVALAEIQGREPGALVVEAMREFMTKHREHLATVSRRTAVRLARDAEQHGRKLPESSGSSVPRGRAG